MSLSLIKRSSSPHPPPPLLPILPSRPPPPGSWLQLWKPMGESLHVLGLGDERLWWASWAVPGAACIRFCTDMDLPKPRSTWLGPEQQLRAGGTRGSSSRLICLLQEPSSLVLSLPLLWPSLPSPKPRPRSSPTLLSSVCVPKPPQKSSMSGEASVEVARTKLLEPPLRLGGGGGGSLARRGNPPSTTTTPPPPPLLTLFGVRMGGELPTASSLPLSGVVA